MAVMVRIFDYFKVYSSNAGAVILMKKSTKEMNNVKIESSKEEIVVAYEEANTLTSSEE